MFNYEYTYNGEELVKRTNTLMTAKEKSSTNTGISFEAGELCEYITKNSS